MRSAYRTLTALLLLVLALAARDAAAARPLHGPPSALPWIHDDVAKAVASARARQVPIVAELGASWCHSCRSMEAYVFPDPSLARHAGDFVWLSIDTENPRNADFRRRFPTPGIPTLLVLDPTATTVRLRWIGSLTLYQLHALLDDARAGGNAPRSLLARLAHADSLYGAARYAQAAEAYAGVLAEAPAGWSAPARARVVESDMTALAQAGEHARAIRLANAELPALGRSPSALGVAAAALGSAIALPESTAGRTGAREAYEARTDSLVSDTSFAAAADDRSGAYIALLDARNDAKDDAGARRVTIRWSAFLDEQAARARTPEERAVFDSHRLSAYLELGQPERAVPMLRQSERDLPGDFNPPARLATAFKAMRRWDDALAASDRAMALAYGPRKLLIYETRVDILRGRGDLAAARHTLEAAIAYARALPEGQRSSARIAELQKKLDSFPGS
jgi:tetratricopeptide (TPR) repeat protein